ncbi:MAG: hypothetical protein EOO01_20390 [Chitinophagaceae bacterium]|nr:MAG: hypothetical protein EOO01_20390 [Chitinophagaceae bacterium]
MKIILLVVLTGFICLKTKAQTESSKTPPSQAILLKEVNALVDDYQLAVIKSARCKDNKNYDLASILSKFAPNAVIEVSSLRSGSNIIKRTPREYFSRLKNLCTALNYDSVSVAYLRNIISGTNILRDGNSCIIDTNITQRFEAYRNNARVYCDITVRKIHVSFYLEDGITVGRITRVSIVATDQCLKTITDR